jgi:hypothetical protein
MMRRLGEAILNNDPFRTNLLGVPKTTSRRVFALRTHRLGDQFSERLTRYFLVSRTIVGFASVKITTSSPVTVLTIASMKASDYEARPVCSIVLAAGSLNEPGRWCWIKCAGASDANRRRQYHLARTVAPLANGLHLDHLLSGSIAAEADRIEHSPCTIASAAVDGLDRGDVASSLAFGAVHHVTTRSSSCFEERLGRRHN